MHIGFVEYVGVIMQPTQLTTATISQQKDSCMNLLNCRIANYDELHV
jgi:hypothetical protein